MLPSVSFRERTHVCITSNKIVQKKLDENYLRTSADFRIHLQARPVAGMPHHTGNRSGPPRGSYICVLHCLCKLSMPPLLLKNNMSGKGDSIIALPLYQPSCRKKLTRQIACRFTAHPPTYRPCSTKQVCILRRLNSSPLLPSSLKKNSASTEITRQK